MEKTIINLTKAYLGECQARNRYTMFSKIAKKEGFEQISEIFLVTAEQEREHASWLFKLLNQLLDKNGEKFKTITTETEVDTVYGNTLENLESAINGEKYENTEMYPKFAEVAEGEGLLDIAKRLKAIAISEKHHQQRYTKLYEVVKNNTVFKKEKKYYWICRKCGYMEEGLEPPLECPSCGHSKNYFELENENY